MSANRRFVYVLKTDASPPRYYVGLTADCRARLADHNAGICHHTSKHRPWRMHVLIEFADHRVATRFERYLKSGSGRAFASRHFEAGPIKSEP